MILKKNIKLKSKNIIKIENEDFKQKNKVKRNIKLENKDIKQKRNNKIYKEDEICFIYVYKFGKRYKIGCTSNIKIREKSLYNSSVYKKPIQEFKLITRDVYNKEQKIHKLLSNYRFNRKREFFSNLPLEKIIETIYKVENEVNKEKNLLPVTLRERLKLYKSLNSNSIEMEGLIYGNNEDDMVLYASNEDYDNIKKLKRVSRKNDKNIIDLTKNKDIIDLTKNFEIIDLSQ